MIKCTFSNGNRTDSLRHVVMDAVVEKNKRILLIERADFLETEPGKLALPGGYLEKNETTKQGILRELQEETGLTGKVIRLYKILDKPDRTGDLGRQNVSFVYLIKPFKKVAEPDQESKKAYWLTYAEINRKKHLIGFDHYKRILKPYIQERVN
ncbi:MAG: NUDIX domain-containing protein [Candidatus Moranbacteria bacterium]|nr:NUDIX domain-containing protein [Candidatus Moranbacteria bacterium]